MTMDGGVLTFLAVSVALTVAPGPDVLFLASQGLAGGPRAGLAVAMGLSSGLLVHTTLAALGVSALVMASPAAFNVLKAAGAAYLLWLARGAFREEPAGAEAPVPAGTLRQLYRRGVIMNLLNPKVALFFLALLPQFADPARGRLQPQMMKLGLIFMAQVVVVFGAIGLLSGAVGASLALSGRAARAVSVVKGLIFLGLAASLAFAAR